MPVTTVPLSHLLRPLVSGLEVPPSDFPVSQASGFTLNSPADFLGLQLADSVFSASISTQANSHNKSPLIISIFPTVSVSLENSDWYTYYSNISSDRGENNPQSSGKITANLLGNSFQKSLARQIRQN
jgi:hypothetical protein